MAMVRTGVLVVCVAVLALLLPPGSLPMGAQPAPQPHPLVGLWGGSNTQDLSDYALVQFFSDGGLIMTDAEGITWHGLWDTPAAGGIWFRLMSADRRARSVATGSTGGDLAAGQIDWPKPGGQGGEYFEMFKIPLGSGPLNRDPQTLVTPPEEQR